MASCTPTAPAKMYRLLLLYHKTSSLASLTAEPFWGKMHAVHSRRV